MEKLAFIISTILTTFLANAFAGNGVMAEEAPNHHWYNKLTMSIGGGWANYHMKHLSGSFTSSAGHSATLGSRYQRRISGGPGFSAELRFSAFQHLSVNSGFLYLKGETNVEDNSQQFLDDYDNIKQAPKGKFRATLVAPFLELQFLVPISPIQFYSSFGVSWFRGTAKMSLPAYGDDIPFPNLFITEKWSFTSSGLGYALSAGVSYRVIGKFHLASELGYRFLRTGELKDTDGNVWEGMHLDFSGPYVSGGISLGM